MTAVFAIRHPQTTWNATSRYQGRLEAQVSREGQLQSRLVARAFRGAPLAAIFTSPLSRAHYLAAELAQATDAPLIVDQRLVEIAMGPWEGLYLDEIKGRYPDLYRAWYAHPETVHFPGGESLDEVRGRVGAVMSDIYQSFQDVGVAVVTHAVAVQVLAAEAIRLDFRYLHQLHIHNASVTTFCGVSAPGSLLSLNGTEPLYHSPLASATAQACVS